MTRAAGAARQRRPLVHALNVYRYDEATGLHKAVGVDSSGNVTASACGAAGKIASPFAGPDSITCPACRGVLFGESGQGSLFGAGDFVEAP